jgi:hypothetical protein
VESRLTHEFERYYGIVFTSLFEEVSDVRLKKISDNDSAYVLNNRLGLYIKHTTARISPWSYSFRTNDFAVIDQLELETTEIAFGLVCGFHGVCLISSQDLKVAGGVFQGDALRITVRTMRGGSWKVSGTAGELSTTRSKTKPWERFQDFLLA